MNRRGFLGTLARAPVVGAIAKRHMLEQAASGLTGATVSGLGYGSGIPMPEVGGKGMASHKQAKLAMLNPFVRKQVESLMYECEKHVGTLDPDLAVKQSFSLMAKITYQRQRNVARRLNELSADDWWPYQRLQDTILRAIGLKL